MHDEFSQNTGLMFQNMETSEVSISPLSSLLMYWQAVFRARISAWRQMAPGPDLPVPALDFGLSSSAPFAYYDHDTFSWRTCQTSFLMDLAQFSDSWPSSGTMQNGRCSAHAAWVPHTHVSACSLWPTPMASEGMGSGSQAMALREISGQKRTSGHKVSARLRDRVRLLDNGPLNPTWVEWLMGFPLGWTDLEDSEMPLSPSSLS